MYLDCVTYSTLYFFYSCSFVWSLKLFFYIFTILCRSKTFSLLSCCPNGDPDLSRSFSVLNFHWSPLCFRLSERKVRYLQTTCIDRQKVLWTTRILIKLLVEFNCDPMRKISKESRHFWEVKNWKTKKKNTTKEESKLKIQIKSSDKYLANILS